MTHFTPSSTDPHSHPMAVTILTAKPHLHSPELHAGNGENWQHTDTSHCPHANAALPSSVILTRCIFASCCLYHYIADLCSFLPLFPGLLRFPLLLHRSLAFFHDDHVRIHAQSPRVPRACLNRDRDTQSPACQCQRTGIPTCSLSPPPAGQCEKQKSP